MNKGCNQFIKKALQKTSELYKLLINNSEQIHSCGSPVTSVHNLYLFALLFVQRIGHWLAGPYSSIQVSRGIENFIILWMTQFISFLVDGHWGFFFIVFQNNSDKHTCSCLISMYKSVSKTLQSDRAR